MQPESYYISFESFICVHGRGCPFSSCVKSLHPWLNNVTCSAYMSWNERRQSGHTINSCSLISILLPLKSLHLQRLYSQHFQGIRMYSSVVVFRGTQQKMIIFAVWLQMHTISSLSFSNHPIWTHRMCIRPLNTIWVKLSLQYLWNSPLAHVVRCALIQASSWRCRHCYGNCWEWLL